MSHLEEEAALLLQRAHVGAHQAGVTDGEAGAQAGCGGGGTTCARRHV